MSEIRETIDRTFEGAFIDPKVTALLVIDMQNGFCHEDSHMAGVWGTHRQRGIIPDVAKLVDIAHRHDMPVFWSRQVYTKKDVTRGRRRIHGHLTRQKFIPCLEGTWEEHLMDDMQACVGEDDHVMIKHRASFFQETRLSAMLRYHGIEMLLISGVNTEFCVETTVRDGYMQDFDVVVVEECVSNSRPNFHRDTLDKIQAYFGEVVHLNEVEGLIVAE
ncbi:MAG: cysteine hydrolase [Proteobacteria bacterium]|nr:cysteine hydrolase [Pseudomonadota bacterium]MCP4916437.1 cysteine hydrolase [Pseudomonadota bacterium]